MCTLLLLALLEVGTLDIKSTAFVNDGYIPSLYTCEGKDINPDLIIMGIPRHAKSLAIIVDDPDTDHGTFNHWVTWNIRPVEKIAENSSPGKNGKNGAGKNAYKGPCPPSGTHRYFFKVYALDTMLDLKDDADSKEVEKAMKDHIIAQGQLIGLYNKQKGGSK